MRRSGGHRQRGLSLLEFKLAVIIVSLLIVFAFQRIASLQSDMERAAVRSTVAAMREALSLQFARLVVDGDLAQARDYIGGNALALLHPPPAGYAGRVHHAHAADLRPGHWYYDAAAGTVLYRPAYGESSGATTLLRWHVVPRWADVNGDGRYEPGTESVQGLALVRIDESAR